MTRADIARRAVAVLDRAVANGIECFSSESGSWAKLDAIAGLFELSVHENPMLEEKTLGVLDAGLMRISIKPGLTPSLRAFTIAHEIGHAEIHSTSVPSDTEETINEETGLASTDDGVLHVYDPSSRQELEANIFAAELLAPTAIVRARVKSDPAWSVDKLAAYFGISRSAMVSQLSSAFLPGSWSEPKEGIPKGKFDLDDKQKLAVETSTPALVLAGPGAGKTRILVERFVALVKGGVPPERILALTFANKAAGEMVERISSALPEASQGLSVSTFHSFGLEVLKLYGEFLQLPEHPVMLTPAEVFALLRSRLGSIPMGSFEDLRRPTRDLKLLISAVSRAKDELVSPEEFIGLAQAWQDSLESDPNATDADLKLARQALDAGSFYLAYEKAMSDSGSADYGDLIRYAVQLLQDPQVGKDIREKYDHVLVDETQDINFAMAQMLKLLDGGRGIIWAVGDPRQSIYRFRGASSVNLLRFTEDYADAKIVELDQNYRSVGDLVEFSQAFAIPKREAGDDLPVPTLISGRKEDPTRPHILVAEAPDEPSELAWVAAHIHDLRDAGHSLDSIAVLCRTRAQAQNISDALGARNLPNSWAGSLDKRDAFKEVMAALYAASDNLLALTRLWEGSETDLRTLLKARRELKSRSLSHLLFEAAESRIGGLSDAAIAECTKLRQLVGALRSLETAGQVVERFIFEYSPWSRDLIIRAPESSRTSRSTLGEVLAMAKAFARRQPGNKRSAKEFVAFLRISQEAGELKESRADVLPDVVQIMTMHASKGLEWPIVILPYAAKGKMPSSGRQEALPIPKGLINGGDPQDNHIERACLFYVALTRARDSLVVSCATKYGTRNAGLSDYVTPILDAIDHSSKVAFIKAPKVDVLEPAPEPGLGHEFAGAVPLSAIKAVERCPKQFEYQHVLGLHDEEIGYLNFHQSLNETIDWMLEAQLSGSTFSDSDVIAKQLELWREKQPDGHWYEERFLEQAKNALLPAAAAVRCGDVKEGRARHTVPLPNVEVELQVDEIQNTPNGPVVKKHIYGPPAKKHLKEIEQALLHQVGRNLCGAEPPATKVRYPLIQEERESDLSVREIKGRLEKAEKFALLAQVGPYLPDPDMMKCRGCFAALICPSNPEDEED